MTTWYSCGYIFEGHVPEEAALPVELAGGVRIERIPEWAKAEGATTLESWSTRESIQESEAAFVVEFEADALDEGAIKAHEKIFLAGIALWLAQPTGWRPAHIIHFGEKGRSDSMRQSGEMNVLKIATEQNYVVPTAEAMAKAAQLHKAILELPREGAVWSALRYLFIALPEGIWDPRYVMMWVALEALFGPADGREITFRMSQRIALFLGNDAAERLKVFKDARAGYAMRSKVVHGGHLKGFTGEASGELMLTAEDMIRRSIVAVLSDAALRAIFSGGEREKYLDELAFRAGL